MSGLPPGVKRLIGRRYQDPAVAKDSANWPFRVINEDERPKIVVKHKGVERSFFPEEISAMVLDKMKTTAEAYLGAPVRNAVVTVPAYFNDAQRQATKDAAVIAGLNVLRIINEPTAGALAYGLDQDADDERLVLIYDLGGGTFDVSILCIEEGIFEVRATAGDTRLGGEDIDALLANYLANEFKSRYGVDISGDKRAGRRLRTASERAKRTLSSQNEATVELDALYEGLDMHVKVSRAKFEEICGPLLRRTLEPLRQAMTDAKLEPSKLSEVVLVGGSTRIPMVRELLREWFEGRELVQTVNPDEAVAIGAAVQAANLDGDAANVVSDLVLLDVTPLSLGTTLLGKITDIIIPRNTTIPVKKQKQYTTVCDYQTEVRVEVVEGERQMSKDNNLLGYFILTGLTPAPAGVPKILDTFEIDADGILHVTSVETLSNVEKSITVKTERNRLSQEQIKRLIAEAEEFKSEDQAKKEAAEARHELERFCYTIKNRASASTSMPSSTRQSVLSKCEDTIKWLGGNQQAPIEMYRRKKRDLELVANLAFVNL